MQPTKKRLLMALCALLAVSLLVAGCGADDKEDNQNGQDPQAGQMKPLDTTSKKVVAEYNGGKVTEGELNLYLNIFSFFQPQLAGMVQTPEAKKEIVKQYIAERMIAEKVKNHEKYDKAADKALDDFEKQLKEAPAEDGKKKDANAVLKENGIKREELHAFLKNNNKVSDYFEDKVKEADLKKEYDKSKAFVQIELNHVLINTKDPETQKEKRKDEEAKKLAEKVKKKLEDGESFKDIAKKYSEDPGSKDTAGKITGSPEEWDPAFAKAAKSLPVKEISKPVKSEFGYHVIRVNKRGKQPFKDVKDQIKDDKVQHMYQKFIEDEVEVKKINLPDEKKEKK